MQRRPGKNGLMAIDELTVRAVARWCADQVPERARQQFYWEPKVRANAVTIVERRAPWDGSDAEWTARPIGQLRHDPARRSWTLYWPDRHQRWHLVTDVPPAGDVAVLLREIATNPRGIFG